MIPTIWSIYLSFTDGPDYVTYEFVGLQNYAEMLAPDSGVWRELLNTCYYAFVQVALSLIVSVLLANALNSNIRGRSFFRVVYFLPSVTMAAAVGMVWRQLLNSQYGIVNQFLGLFGIKGPTWLTDPNFMMLGVIIVGVWSSAGYNMIILLAGLKNISKSYYEAAEIDGGRQLPEVQERDGAAALACAVLRLHHLDHERIQDVRPDLHTGRIGCDGGNVHAVLPARWSTASTKRASCTTVSARPRRNPCSCWSSSWC